MAGRIAGITIEIGGDTSKLQKALEKVDGPLNKTKSGLKDIERLLKWNPGNTMLLEQKQKNLASAIQKTKERLDMLRKAEEEKKGKDLTEEEQQQFEALQREILVTEKQLKRLEKQMEEFGSMGAQKIAGFGKKVEAFGEKWQAAGEKMTAAGRALMPLTGAIVGVGAASYKAWKEVDEGGDAIARMTGATGEALEEMQALSNEIATEIPASFEATGNAVGEVATRFDLQGEKLKSLASAYVMFADVNKSDVTSAVNSTQKAMAAWNVDAKDAGLYLDALTAAAQKTGVKIETIASQAATNAAALKEVGFGASDAAMFLGMLEKNGVDASGAMAGLKKAYANALKDGTSLKDQLMELETGLQNEETRASAAAAAIELFGTRAGGALTEALASGRISFAELGTDLQDFAGTVENTFNATLDPIDKVKTTLNELKLSGADLFDAAGPLITEVLDKATAGAQKLSKWLGTLSDDEKRQAIRMAGLAAAAGPVLMVVGKLTSGVGKVISTGGKLLQMAPKIVGTTKKVTSGITGLNGSVLSTVKGLAAAHPAILAVVAALSVFAGAMLYAKKENDKYLEKVYGLTEAEKEHMAALAESAQAYNEAESARKETMRGISSEYDYYQKLAQELQSITDADGRVLEGKEARAEFIVGTLSDALGLEISMVDGVIQKNNELVDSIDQVIEKKKAEAMLAADMEHYTEAQRGQIDAAKEYYGAVKDTAEAYRKVEAAQQKYDAARRNTDPSNIFASIGAQSAALKELKAAKDAYNEYAQAEQNAATKYYSFKAAIENHEALAEAAISGEGLSEAMAKVASGFLTAETASASMLEGQVQNFAETFGAMADMAASGMAEVTDAELSEMATMLSLSMAEAQKAGVDIGTVLAESLKGMTPETQAAVMALMQAASPSGEINTAEWSAAGSAPPQAYAEGMQGGTSAVQNASATLEQAAAPPAADTGAWSAAGAAPGNAYAGGLQGTAGTAQAAGQSVGSAGAAGVQGTQGEMQTAGTGLGDANAQGIQGTSGQNQAAGVAIANSAKSGAGSVSLYDTGYSTGASYGSGLVAGLRSMLAQVQATARALTQAAGSAGNAGLEINSPSHVAERTGLGYGEGLILGLNKMQRDVGRAAARLAGYAAAGVPTAGVPAAMVDYPRQQAAIAAQQITVTAQTAPTDSGVSRMLGAILTRLNNLDVEIRNAGQFADGVTNYANRRLGRISTLQESGVI